MQNGRRLQSVFSFQRCLLRSSAREAVDLSTDMVDEGVQIKKSESHRVRLGSYCFGVKRKAADDYDDDDDEYDDVAR